jgi:predicted metal-dependent phosphoesterase TrpH
VLDGYRVLAVDFHTHSSTWSDGALTPLGLVMEADRQGLDALAITGHNQVSDSEAGRWFSRLIGGPTVIIGQEILTSQHHVIAAGIHRVVDFRMPLDRQIDDVHAQGGVAIAAHPTSQFWRYYDPVMTRLDGGEICHPLVFGNAGPRSDLERFAERGPIAAIGSSDFHGLGRVGMCRTYVFARDTSAEAIVDAVRLRRTVVYGEDGRSYGDPSLIRRLAAYPDLRRAAAEDRPAGAGDQLSRLTGLLGMLGLVWGQAKRHRHPPRDE